MGKPLRVLLVEDNADDAALLVRDLRKKGYDVSAERVETAEAYALALDGQLWDVLLVDFRMPNFSALSALKIMQDKGLDLPFIVVSGTITEEEAIGLMLAGAQDFLTKDNLARLAPILEREMLASRTREERIKAFQALRESEVRCRTIFETSPDGIVLTDPETRFIMANSQFVRLFGFDSIDDLLTEFRGGRPLFDLFDGRDRDRAMRCLQGILGEGIITAEVFLARRKDGTVFDTEVSAALIRDQGGEAAAFMIVCRDITERRAMEDITRSSEERLKIIFENAPDALYLNDLKGVFTDGNAAAERLTGYLRQELIGKNFFSLGLLPPKYIPKAMALLARNLKGEPTGPDELTLRHRDGSLVDVEISTHPLKIAGKSLVLGIARDITERKRAESLLLESEKKYRDLVDSSPLGIYKTNLEGRILFANQAMAEMLGFRSPKEILPLNVGSFYKDARRREFWLEELKKKRRANNFELEMRTKNNETLHVIISGVLEDGIISGTIKDISEIKHAQRQLEQSYARLRENLGDTVLSLSKILEHRDPYTAGHQARVTRLALAIGRELGVPEKRLEGLSIAGHLHDIGKVSIPSEILSKPSRLSSVEMSLIRTHAQAGHDILRDIKFPWPVADIVLQHHERLDGSGYPRGIRGKDILLEARILAVADVVEAMATHRPYRPALGIDKALAEIAKGKGVVYDKEVAAACLALIRKKGFDFEAAGVAPKKQTPDLFSGRPS